MRTAPFAVGYFAGDYEGLDNAGNAFTPLYVIANNGDLATGRTCCTARPAERPPTSGVDSMAVDDRLEVHAGGEGAEGPAGVAIQA